MACGDWSYRGYDRLHLRCYPMGKWKIRKRAGRISNLAQLIQQDAPRGTIGLGHTRWATPRGVTDANAHPHLDRAASWR